MQYKLLGLDLDGTLTNNKKEITGKTLTILKKAQEQGLRIVLASGRPTYGIAPLAEKLGLNRYGGYVLSYNGGEITSWETKETFYRKFLDPEDLPALYDYTESYGFTIVTYMDKFVLTEDADNEYVHKMALLNGMTIKKVDHFLDAINQPLSKCIIAGEQDRLVQLEKDMQEVFKDKISVFRSEPYFLEIVPKGIDKARSLAVLLERIGLTREEMVAIGDGFNDLSMIKYAGLGVAMANAQDIILKNADFITFSNEEDGVAHVVEKFIL